eukprot:5276443-Pleurochrysis_carterae.AAC.1
MLGPSPEDAMNETLTDDDGNVTAQISIYFTNNYNSVNISKGFETYTPDFDELNKVYNTYRVTSYGIQVPWVEKNGSGSGVTHPSDSGIVLSGAINGDISSHAPALLSDGLVFRITLKISGAWELHDTFLMPTNPTSVPRQTWQGRTAIDQSAFIESYSSERPMIRPHGQGILLGEDLLDGDQVFFTVDNYDCWDNDSFVLRFRLTCSPA